ncbi:hypothetical protein GBAR_LOCUS26421, partial [Geodia barretti]
MLQLCRRESLVHQAFTMKNHHQKEIKGKPIELKKNGECRSLFHTNHVGIAFMEKLVFLLRV